MNIQEQVVSLDLAKKLAKCGLPQESIFFWVCKKDALQSIRCFGLMSLADMLSIPEGSEHDYEVYSAFTVSELFDFLPASLDIKQNEPFNNFYLHVDKRHAKNIQYIANYVGDSVRYENDARPLMVDTLFRPNCYSENLAQALGELLVRIIEKGIGNDRLQG